MTGPYTEPAFDPAASGPQPSAEEIESAARESVKSGVDIRQRIHDLTLLALRNRRFDRRVVGETAERLEHARIRFVPAQREAGRDVERHLVSAVRYAAT